MLAEAAKQEHLGGRIENGQESSWQWYRRKLKEDRKRAFARRQLVKSGDNQGRASHLVTIRIPVLQRRQAKRRIEGQRSDGLTEESTEERMHQQIRITVIEPIVINFEGKENAPEKIVRLHTKWGERCERVSG